LNILKERTEIARHVICYSEFLYKNSKLDIKLVQSQFGIPSSLKQTDEQILCAIALNLIVKRLSEIVQHHGSIDSITLPSAKVLIDIKIPENKGKVSYKKVENILVEFFDEISVKICKTQTPDSEYRISFRKGDVDRFWIYILSFSREDMLKAFENSDVFKPLDYKSPAKKHKGNIQQSKPKILRITDSSSRATLYEDAKERQKRVRKPKEPEYLKDKPLQLYIDKDGDLAIRGEIDQRYSRVVIKGITKVLFNRSGFSMLSLLNTECISKDVAEKAAQLAFGGKSAKLTGPEALEKFKSLTKK
jgi:hypothetical protein